MKMTGFDTRKLLSTVAIAAIVPCTWLLGCNDTPKTDSTTTTQSQAVPTTPSATPAASAVAPGMAAPSGAPAMQGPGGNRGAMMQAGIDACNGKANGDACSMTDGSHTMSGKCAAPPAGAADTKLSCRPEGGPGGDHGPHMH